MIIDCAVYADGYREPGELRVEDAASACRRQGAFVWIGLYEPTEEEFETVAGAFELHELAVEDAVIAHQRPKLELYDESIFIVLKTARYVDAIEAVELGEIQIFVGDGFVVHVRHGEASPLSGARRQAESRPDLLRHGPAAVAHAIVDRVVDDYAPVIAGIENDIREVEYQVFSESDANAVERIYKLKREVLELHEATEPLTEPLDRLVRHQFPLIPDDLDEYFRDVHDHLLRIVERVTTARDLLTSVLEATLTRVSVRQNEDMRKISAWVAIAVVPTLVAGVYGMNFEHMPELGWAFGYPIALALMAAVCGCLYWRFRRSGWL
ncbi:MAG TPA: magnesium/cobalt transporter CorA [Acidimicrobiia bacterium]